MHNIEFGKKIHEEDVSLLEDENVSEKSLLFVEEKLLLHYIRFLGQLIFSIRAMKFFVFLDEFPLSSESETLTKLFSFLSQSQGFQTNSVQKGL